MIFAAIFRPEKPAVKLVENGSLADQATSDHNLLGFGGSEAQATRARQPEILTKIFVVDRPIFRYSIYPWSRDHPLCLRPTTISPRNLSRRRAPPGSTRPRNTTPLKSINSKALKRSGSGPGMYIGDPDERGLHHWFSKFSTTRSTNISPAIATKSKSPFTSMVRFPSAITAAAFRSTFIRNGRCRRSSWC